MKGVENFIHFVKVLIVEDAFWNIHIQWEFGNWAKHRQDQTERVGEMGPSAASRPSNRASQLYQH